MCRGRLRAVKKVALLIPTLRTSLQVDGCWPASPQGPANVVVLMDTFLKAKSLNSTRRRFRRRRARVPLKARCLPESFMFFS
ncbi:hypothetical protein DY000_02018362 [Brassica cretica]|uniref:Secreted protein n=1 Tax=Brassica cretica TaxID=69181 RepID=A0ABQ7D2H4_BRACR|nr:hypothetical protein DY000_02018362 [Brassica cretica]